MKRIFYFNITYTCNSSCIFCYSHNTIHSGKLHNEIDVNQFIHYLQKYHVNKNDRVIINGGEPFLHPDILNILKSVKHLGCEVLVYTNGRMLHTFDLSFLDERFRFVIPIHGYKELHDTITRVKESFYDTQKSLEYIKTLKCGIDIKVIINNAMASNLIEVEKTLLTLEKLPIKNAIHITKMAETIVSKQNNCSLITQQQAAQCTKQIFDFFKNKGLKIKIFDTCVAYLKLDKVDISFDCPDAQVFFKDNKHEWEFKCYEPDLKCSTICKNKYACFSAVGNYHVLEYNNGKFYRGFE